MTARNPAKHSLWRTVKAVAWSFVGLRGQGDYEEDVQRLSLLHIVMVGLLGVFIFVAGLMWLVHWVVR